METNPDMELIEAERIARQLRLVNDVQIENLVGCWERAEGELNFFWSDSMFALHELPPSPDNTISTDEAAALVHPADIEHVMQARDTLERTGNADFTCRIVTPTGKTKRIHALEKRIEDNGMVGFQG
jgi:hypothetical protein